MPKLNQFCLDNKMSEKALRFYDELEHLSSLSPGRQNEKKMIMYFYLHTPVKNHCACSCVFLFYAFIRFLQSTQKNVVRINHMDFGLHHFETLRYTVAFMFSPPILLSSCLAHQTVLTSY